jgi:acyl-CoA dehydrogenase
MQLSLSTEDQLFQSQVRAFLQEALTPELREAGRKRTSLWQEINSSMQWQRALHAKGWVAPEWPVEYGGTNWSLSQRYIFARECALAEAPALVPMSLRMCGPMLIGHGTDTQKAHYLPRILSGEDIWCQGYSEPGSGSDLASLKTSALSDGDDYVVNGSKIWTSYAQHANMMFALVRTSNEGKVQQGISFLLIEMDSPGVRVEPIINLEGTHEFNQVFFDDVRVPKSNRVGAENNGWSVAKYLLEFERFTMSSAELRRVFDKITALARITCADGTTLDRDVHFQDKLHKLEIECLALEGAEQRVLSSLSTGNSPGPVSSVTNTLAAELLQRADELGIEVAAYYGLPYQPEALMVGTLDAPIGPQEAITLMPSYLSNRMKTIAGGSSEIQRNIIAKNILGL